MMQALDELNTQLTELLGKLTALPAEDETVDNLVSDLLALVGKRQLLLNTLLADESFTDKAYLQQQLALTESFTRQSTEMRAHRQALLHLGSKSKRQVNVYKAIDANR
ncbi:flagella biosynthesis chaperone for FliD, FliT [Shewanella submarina]|uniref:Flagella biosynthesis chaperone for FliD, FliT n=2 Tax=Shewanella submarina TaxID=2016376 RepID=A0ABV7GJG8_9GAMM